MGGAASTAAADEAASASYTLEEAKALAGDAWNAATNDMFTARFTEVQGPDGRVPAELLRVSHDIGTWDELVVLPPPPPPRKADASDEPFVMPKLDVLAMADMVAAVMLVQRVYRQFKASFTLRKKAAWKIYQEIEYRTERKETGMSDFLTRLQEHLPQMVEEAAETEVGSRFDEKIAKGWPRNMKIEDEYDGPHLPDTISPESMLSLLNYYHESMFLDEFTCLHTKYVLIILCDYLKMLQRQPGLNEISTAIPKCFTVVGDLHGQLRDLVEIFRINGPPSSQNPYLFNGDLVDRGEFSLEVSIMIMGLAVADPFSVYINRGNHEDYMVCQHYGFLNEIFDKYGTGRKHGKAIVNLFAEVFKFLPIASVIDREIFVIHGGISPRFAAKTLRDIPRHHYATLQGGPPEKQPTPNEGKDDEWQILMDAVWSDPEGGDYSGWEDNPNRGAGIMFGVDITKKWLDMHGFSLMIRSHECEPEGFKVMHEGRLMTLFSASNYYEDESNMGAFVRLDRASGMKPRLHQFITSENDEKRVLSLRRSVGEMERGAVVQIRSILFEYKATLTAEFEKLDPEETGYVTLGQWADMLSRTLVLNLPWMKLKDHFVESMDDGRVQYHAFLKSVEGRFAGKNGAVPLSEAIYRNRTEMESLFRIMDTDSSGHLSKEEFHRACQLLNKCSGCETAISAEEAETLLSAMDADGDGSVSFNEFLEAVRMTSPRAPRGGGAAEAEPAAPPPAPAG